MRGSYPASRKLVAGAPRQGQHAGFQFVNADAQHRQYTPVAPQGRWQASAWARLSAAHSSSARVCARRCGSTSAAASSPAAAALDMPRPLPSALRSCLRLWLKPARATRKKGRLVRYCQLRPPLHVDAHDRAVNVRPRPEGRRLQAADDARQAIKLHAHRQQAHVAGAGHQAFAHFILHGEHEAARLCARTPASDAGWRW